MMKVLLALSLSPLLLTCGIDGGDSASDADVSDDGGLSDGRSLADAVVDGAGSDSGRTCAPFSDPAPAYGTDCENNTSPGSDGDEPATTSVGDVTAHLNRTYATRDGRVLQGDIYVPSSGEGTPGAIVVVHGGGWQDCERRRDATAAVAYVMAVTTGAVVFNIEYRLAHEGGAYPHALSDVFCATQWFAEQAETYGFDGSRVALIGGSAGAQLALMTAMTAHRDDIDPECGAPVSPVMTVSYSAPTDLPYLVANPGPVDVSGAPKNFTDTDCAFPVERCSATRACDACVDASPVAQACNAQGEIILVHAPDPWDGLIPEEQVDRLHDALKKAGMNVTLIKPTIEELQAAENCTTGQAHALVPCLTDLTGGKVVELLAPKVGPQ